MEKIKVEYERNLSGSFMKIEGEEKESFDEKMLVKQKIPGILPMEKCYVNGGGQYWYNISGRQSLDTFCKIKPVGEAFLEQLLHSICEELRLLEQHLMDANCLCLETELIYISNATQEISFTFLPGISKDLQVSFRELMESILAKIDHKDAKAVALAYEIYEKTLDEGYSIEEIHASMIEAHTRKMEETENRENEGKEIIENDGMTPEVNGRVATNEFIQKWIDKCKNWWNKLWKNKIRQRITKEKSWGIVYPEDVVEEELHEKIHPTICLSDYREHPEGILLYEGYEHFSNIRLEEKDAQIGQGDEMDVTIKKDTVSRYHARIAYENKEYYLEDLNSTNGTFVNDEPLTYRQKRKLKSNDIVRFADVKYRFV